MIDAKRLWQEFAHVSALAVGEGRSWCGGLKEVRDEARRVQSPIIAQECACNHMKDILLIIS